MRERAQASHLFLSLLTIIIFALIILFGYKLTTTFKAKSESLILLKFERDVQATLQSVTYGTTKIRTFDVPPGYEYFWLIDPQQPSCTADNCGQVPAEILDAWQSPNAKNAYLLGPEKIHAFTLDRLKIAAGCLCMEITNQQVELALSQG